MKGAVVYYSRYGNNEKTAKAILAGLEEAGQEADLINAKERKELAGDYDFMIVGSPTRAGKVRGPVKKFMDKNITEQWKGRPFAAFGTCMTRSCEKDEPTAAKDIYDQLKGMGLDPLADAFDNPVSGMKGPMASDGEEKARAFGKEVGSKLSAM
jgi:menaquinone-dependent protoporphyrinogen IX oxidase